MISLAVTLFFRIPSGPAAVSFLTRESFLGNFFRGNRIESVVNFDIGVRAYDFVCISKVYCITVRCPLCWVECSQAQPWVLYVVITELGTYLSYSYTGCTPV
jgi:hypothetical protein